MADRLDLEGRKGAESEQLFRMLVFSVRDYAIFMLDPDGHVATWNAGAERLKGYQAAEIIGRHFSAFYPEEDVRAGKCEMELRVASEVGRFEDEDWRIRKDGSRFWANVVITAVRDATGRLVGFAKVTRDLTERKAAEDERERFRMLVDSVHDYALFVLDPAGRVTTWNPGAERINGYRADEILGRHFSAFYPDEDVRAGKCEIELERATRDGRFEDEGWRVRKDGSRFWADVVISAIRDAKGNLVGFSKVTRDLTDRKRAEDDRAARLAAEQANRAKDAFIAMLGHELRNPLAPILTAIQLIKLRGETRNTREHQIIERQAHQMMRLVDDLLDVSRIARGKIELKKQPFDVRAAIARAIEIAGPLFEQRGHHFEIKTPGRALMIDGDEARLTQVFANLLTNAGKYTEPAGHIFVLVRQIGPEIVVEVRDNGIGIDPELLPRIFDLYVQGADVGTRASGGLGLGLALVRSLVELHGGRVEVRSHGRGLGSSFTVHLPALHDAAPADDEGAIKRAFHGPPARRLLVVDDNEDARMLLADILTSLGHDVHTAGDGLEALELAKQIAPDVAILDLGLPGIDGYELARRLRADPATAEIRLIALSGSGQSSARETSRAVGFDRHLLKPVDVHGILGAIAEVSAES